MPGSDSILSSCGSDGCVSFWDLNRFSKLYSLSPPITHMESPLAVIGGDFNHDGSLYAYALSDDYSKGQDNNNHSTPSRRRVHVHRMLHQHEQQHTFIHSNDGSSRDDSFSLPADDNAMDLEYGTNQSDSFFCDSVLKRRNIFFDQVRKSRSHQQLNRSSSKHLSSSYSSTLSEQQLPTELVMEIITFLSFDDLQSASRIDTTFRTAVFNLHSLQLPPYRIKLHFLQSFGQLKKLEFSMDTIDDNMLSTLCNEINELEELVIQMNPIMKRSHLDVSVANGHVKNLTVRNCQRIQLPLIISFESLTLQHCGLVTKHEAVTHDPRSPLLRLSLSSSPMLVNHVIDILTFRQLIDLDLSHVDLQNVPVSKDMQCVNLNLSNCLNAQEHVKNIFCNGGYKHLRTLNISGMNLSNLLLPFLASCSEELQKMSLTKLIVRSCHLDDHDLQLLISHLPHLKILDVSHNDSLRRLRLGFLCEISFSHCVHFSDLFMFQSFQPNVLTSVDFSSTCVNDESLDAFFCNGGQSLVRMNLSKCMFVSLASLTECHIPTTLENVNISFCANVGHDAAERFLVTCVNIRHMDVTGCDLVRANDLRLLDRNHRLRIVKCGMSDPGPKLDLNSFMKNLKKNSPDSSSDNSDEDDDGEDDDDDDEDEDDVEDDNEDVDDDQDT
ncbi:hypothetical protein AKO1_015732 [Acrasis kona]|uniref:F-box domain-containing protein n=1 Tax=Acrasis kona TaxID=1008807 RepID=A0AAW2ZI97_9EUKA